MSTSPLPPTSPVPIGISLAQAAKLTGWVALDGRSEIVGHALAEADLRSVLGHFADVAYMPTHLFESTTAEDRRGNYPLNYVHELRQVPHFPEHARAAAARLPARLWPVVHAVSFIEAEADSQAAAIWALVGWFRSSESRVLAVLARLEDRRIVSFRTGPEGKVWLTPHGRQVARLLADWRTSHAG